MPQLCCYSLVDEAVPVALTVSSGVGSSRKPLLENFSNGAEVTASGCGNSSNILIPAAKPSPTKLATPTDLFELYSVIPLGCRLTAGIGKFNSIKLGKLVEFPLATSAVAALRQVATQLGLPLEKLQTFAVAVEKSMPGNPYHNNIHVTDVLQLMYLQTVGDGPLSQLCRDPIVKLSALLAALVHDLSHPGFNNAFLKATKHPLCSEHGEDATAERMHVSLFKKMIQDPQMDFLEPLPPENRERVVGLVEDAVLSTDMARHRAVLQETVPQDDEAALRFRLGFALKVSDMSHNVRAFQVHNQFVDMLKEEFYQQGDRERELGMQISPGMDRDEGYAAVGESQVQFLSVFIEPLLEQWSLLNTNSSLTVELLDYLTHNIQMWAMLSGTEKGPQYSDNRLEVTRGTLMQDKTAIVRRAHLTTSFSFMAVAYGLADDDDEVKQILLNYEARAMEDSGPSSSGHASSGRARRSTMPGLGVAPATGEG